MTPAPSRLHLRTPNPEGTTIMTALAIIAAIYIVPVLVAHAIHETSC